MRRAPRSLCGIVSVIVFFVAFAVPVGGTMAAPMWTVGDFWEYALSQAGTPIQGTLRMDVTGMESATVGGISYPSYRLEFAEHIEYPGFGTIDGTGVFWHQTSDYSLVAQYSNFTINVPPTRSTAYFTAAFDPPERIQWPLSPSDAWTASGWVNSSVMFDVPPPTWNNVTVTIDFSVLPEQTITVPAGTFLTTPLRGQGDYTNLTYWSPPVGNGVLLQVLDPTGAEVSRMELTDFLYQSGGTGNALPVVNLSSPVGGESWTGGSVHDITYSTADPDNATLDVTIQWSSDRGATWSPVASLSNQATGSHAFPWTVPAIDTARARVRVCASDRVNVLRCDASPFDFAIDSTPPAVASTSPPAGAMDVGLAEPVSIVFSELMDMVPTQAAIAITPSVGGVAYSWAGTTLTVSHSAFDPCALYSITVLLAAQDASDPGNSLLVPYTWSFTTDCAPEVVLTAPTGGEVWSSGSLHAIQFTITDADPVVDVWIDASLDDGVTWLALSPRTLRQTGANSVQVAMPTTMADESAIVRISAEDSAGLDDEATSAPFTVDGTVPTVTASYPVPGAMDVNPASAFLITFSEAMDGTSVEDAIALAPSAGALTFSWSGDTLTVTHASLQPEMEYTLTVGATARDASEPGNPLAGDYVIVFRTSMPVPLVANAGGPYTGRVGELVTLDGSASTGAIANYTWTIAPATGGPFSLFDARPTFVPATAGDYVITLRVRDDAGNAATDTATASIAARDTAPPVITHTPPAAVYTGEDIRIEVDVTDAGGQVREVRLEYTTVGGTNRNVTMTLSGVRAWSYTIPGESSAGTVRYRIYAVDMEGNAATSQLYSVPVRTRPTSAPSANLTWILAALILVVLLAVALFAWRRRRGAEPQPPSPPESTAPAAKEDETLR